MAIATLIFGRKSKPMIDEIELDCNINESHQYQNQVTQFPIEDGSDISDHIIDRPTILTINGFVTNAPVNFLGVASTLIKGIGRSRTAVAFDELIDLLKGKFNPSTKRRERKVFEVATGLHVYTDMVFVSITFPRNRGTDDQLRFNATMQEIKKVSSQTVKIPQVKTDDVGSKADPKQKVGKVTAPESKPQTKEKAASVLIKGFRKVFPVQ